jgi:hypothetical protein
LLDFLTLISSILELPNSRLTKISRPLYLSHGHQIAQQVLIYLFLVKKKFFFSFKKNFNECWFFFCKPYLSCPFTKKNTLTRSRQMTYFSRHWHRSFRTWRETFPAWLPNAYVSLIFFFNERKHSDSFLVNWRFLLIINFHNL